MTISSPSPQASMLFYWHENEFEDHNFQIHGRTLFFAMALFSIVLFFALLTLYIHRTCSPGDFNLHNSSPSISLVGSNGGLDPAAIRSLPVVLCLDLETIRSLPECCICLGGFEEGDKMKVLPLCRHCYHCECVDRWLRTESTCPLCRVSIRVDSSVSLPTLRD